MARSEIKALSSIVFPGNFDFEKYEAQGVDISLLTSMLRQTPTERLENNVAMQKFILMVRKNNPIKRSNDPNRL